MSAHRSRRDQVIVLRHWPYAESDRIMNFFGRASGKFRAIAKGLRKPNARLGGRLETGALVDVQLWAGRNLDVVQQAQIVEPHAHIRTDYDRSMAAAAVLEVVDAFAQEGQQDHALFATAAGALAALNAAPPHPSLFVDAVIGRVLHSQGFPLAIDECAVCGNPEGLSRVQVAQGGVVCESCAGPGARELHPHTAHALRLLIDGTWNDVTRLANATTEVRHETAATLREHLDRNAGVTLKTWDTVAR